MLTRGHLNIRSLSRRYNRLFKGSSKPCSGLSSRDRRENLAWYARPGFPTGWSPPTHQIQELELMFKCPLLRNWLRIPWHQGIAQSCGFFFQPSGPALAVALFVPSKDALVVLLPGGEQVVNDSSQLMGRRSNCFGSTQ